VRIMPQANVNLLYFLDKLNPSLVSLFHKHQNHYVCWFQGEKKIKKWKRQNGNINPNMPCSPRVRRLFSRDDPTIIDICSKIINYVLIIFLKIIWIFESTYMYLNNFTGSEINHHVNLQWSWGLWYLNWLREHT